jgi:hypothetical protein
VGLYDDEEYDDFAAEEDIWEQQARLPLRERDGMWWAAVALPTTILTAWVVASVLWILGVL